MPKDNEQKKRRLFSEYDVFEPSTSYEAFDHDHDEYYHYRPGRGGYRPLHPFREAFTIAAAFAVILVGLTWLLMKVL